MEVTFSLEAAVSAHETGDLTTAITLYRALLLHDPSRADLLTNLGIAFCQSGNASAGIDALEQAVALSDYDPETLYNLGYALVENGRLVEAVPVLRRAAELHPEDTDIREALVRAGGYTFGPDSSIAEPEAILASAVAAASPKRQADPLDIPTAVVVEAPLPLRGRERRTRPPAQAHQDWHKIMAELSVLEEVYRSHGFDEKLRGLEVKRRDLLDPSVYVFIIGEGKFGKSSLINHLLGVKVAETGKVPKTWRVDLYRPSQDGREFAELTRHGVEDSEILSVEDAVKICDDQEPDVLDRVHAAKPAAEGGADQDLVAAEGQVIQVDWSRADLALDARVTLVDTPGFAQPRGRASARADALHRSEGVAFDIDDISEFYYHRSDLVLWAFKATKLEDADTMKSLKLLSKETKRVLGVLTHWDQIEEADRPGRLSEARKRFGDYVVGFVCVDCKGSPGAPKEGVGDLRDWLRREADRAAAIKLQSAHDYRSDQAKFAAEWLQSLGDSLVRNVAEVAMYANGASDALLRAVTDTHSALMGEVDDRVARGNEAGILAILQSSGTQAQKQERIEEFLLVSGLNDRLGERLRADGHHLSVQGSNLARQRKLQQVVIKGRGASEYRSMQARIDPPHADGIAVGLSGVSIPSVAGGFMDMVFDLFQGTWLGGVAEFFGGRSSADRQEEAVRKAILDIRGALREQVHDAVTAFTRAGAEAILASSNSGVSRAYPGRDLTALRQYARLIDEQMLLLSGIDAVVIATPRFENHYMLWSPVDDGRQVVLGLFCSWFETQQGRIRAHIAGWGREALAAHPLSVSYVYACVRNVIAESGQWFEVKGRIALSRLTSTHYPSLSLTSLMAPNAWVGALVASVKSRDPFVEGIRFLQEVFPGLPDDAFRHFHLDGLGHAFSSRLSEDFIGRCREHFNAAVLPNVAGETAAVRFMPAARLATKSCVGVTACAAVFVGLFSGQSVAGSFWHAIHAPSLTASLVGIYAGEFHTFLQSALAATRAVIAVLLIQYLYFLSDKNHLIVSIVTDRASQSLRQICTDAWRDVTESFGPEYARAVASEFTLVGMRPLDYARDGLIEKYRTDVLRKG